MDISVPSHPEPPENFAEYKLPLIKARANWFRIHKSKYGAIYFSKKGVSRYDDPLKEYGVLYCGQDLHVAVVETLGQSTGNRFVFRKQLAESKLAHITSDKDLQFVDLTGNGLAHLGADAELCVGRDRGLCQRWSRSFWQHPAKQNGIRYISRHDPGRVCYALFENFDTNILFVEDCGFLNERRILTILAGIFDHYKFYLVN